jgi:hypothetical protein
MEGAIISDIFTCVGIIISGLGVDLLNHHQPVSLEARLISPAALVILTGYNINDFESGK